MPYVQHVTKSQLACGDSDEETKSVTPLTLPDCQVKISGCHNCCQNNYNNNTPLIIHNACRIWFTNLTELKTNFRKLFKWPKFDSGPKGKVQVIKILSWRDLARCDLKIFLVLIQFNSIQFQIILIRFTKSTKWTKASMLPSNSPIIHLTYS